MKHRSGFEGRIYPRVLVAMLAVTVVFSLSRCGGGGGGQPELVRLSDASGRSITDTNNNGVPDIPLDSRPTVMSALSGFAPYTAVEVQILHNGVPMTDPATGEPLILQLTTDANGNVPQFPLWDLGVDPDSGLPDDGATGTYTIVATAQGKRVTLQFEVLAGRSTRPQSRQAGTGTVVVLAGGPWYYPQGSVLAGDPVAVEGFGFLANQQVKVFIVPDTEEWVNGATLSDVTGGAETVTCTAQGDLPRTTVWQSAQRQGNAQTDGDFDVVVDVNRNDRYDTGVDVVSGMLGTSFTVQEVTRSRQVNGHLAVQLSASTQRAFKDVFDVREPVAVWVNPPWRPLLPGKMVRKYVVLHRDNWQNGDELVDVTGRAEWDMVRYACANQYSCPVWYPLLTPGKYDVIIDVDEDGKYTLGVDYIDAGIGTGGAGFEVTGTPPPIRLVLNAAYPTMNINELNPVVAQVQTDEGQAVAGATVSFSIISGQGGTLSSSSATTDGGGIARVHLTATQPNTTLVVRATATYGERTASAEVSVRVRAPGELGVVIR